MKFIYTFTIIFSFIALALSFNCEGKVNQNPILTIEPKLVQQVKHGSKYVIQNNGQKLYIVNVTGTAWQMGYAYGHLMKNEMKSLIQQYFLYIYEHAEEQLKLITKLPKILQPLGKAVTLAALRNILRLNQLITRKYTPSRFRQQISAMAEASGIDKQSIIEINMIPEYTKAGCSMAGLWGSATQNNHLLQLRALDWDAHAPLNKYPSITVYHSTQPGSFPFANVGWAGFVGSITGFSENIGMSQKLRGQKTNQNMTRFGKPWNYAVRDVLQFTQTIQDAVRSLGLTDRTCSIFLGIGSKKSNTFRLVQYSYKQFNVYDDTDFPYTEKHGQLNNVVYMPIHDDSSHCFNDLFNQNYGKINSEWMMRTLAPLHRTGDTQLAVYNFQTKQLLLQYSRDGVMAYERSGLRIDLGKFY